MCLPTRPSLRPQTLPFGGAVVDVDAGVRIADRRHVRRPTGSPPHPVAEKSDTALCHGGAVKIWLHPLPPSSQTVLLQAPSASASVVPPTATTSGEDAGKLAPPASSRGTPSLR